MLAKATRAVAIAALYSSAFVDERRTYTVTVIEQTRQALSFRAKRTARADLALPRRAAFTRRLQAGAATASDRFYAAVTDILQSL
jgi:hypothetical protein